METFALASEDGTVASKFIEVVPPGIVATLP